MPRDLHSVVTIGAYDGVHVGHRRVIEQVRRRAADEGLRSVVVTFDRHPAAVIHPASAPALLTDADQKLELLEATGVDEVVVVRFDEKRAKETAEDFVTEVLVGEVGAKVVVVGDDFHFGHERKGNVALLREMGAEVGFRVEPVQLVADDAAHEVVSSTRIRSLIARGQLDEAAALLGRAHEVRGLARLDPTPSEGGGVLVEIPSGVALPPAGRYAGRLGADGATSGAGADAVLSVQGQAEGGVRLVEASAFDGGAALAELAAASTGDDRRVRLRFG